MYPLKKGWLWGKLVEPQGILGQPCRLSPLGWVLSEVFLSTFRRLSKIILGLIFKGASLGCLALD